MPARNFNPMLTRRAVPAAPKAAGPSPARGGGASAGSPRGVPRFIAAAAAAPAVSTRNDHWEREAHHVAETAGRTPASSAVAPPAARAHPSTPRLAPPAPRRGPRQAGTHRFAGGDAASSRPVTATRDIVSAVQAHPAAALETHAVTSELRTHATPSTGPPSSGHSLRVFETAPIADVTDGGHSLPLPLRHRLEAVLGTDLGVLRIHTGPAAQHVAAHVEARAFTIGSHIYLNAGESPDDVGLIAHEAAHTVQQSAFSPATPARGPPRSSGTLALTAAPRGMIQRTEAQGAPPQHWWQRAGHAVGSAVGTVTHAAADGFWWAVDQLAPQRIADLLHQIRDHGFWSVLRTKISGALDFVFAAMRRQGGTAAQLATLFQRLLDRVRPIVAALAAGDCQPLFQAVRDLGDVFSRMAGEAWDQIVDFLRPVGEWLENVWTSFGAPVVDFLKQFASDAWDWIKDLGQQLWDLTAPIRAVYANAWTEIKRLLGFDQGTDDDGSGGLVGWIQTKAGEIWDGIKEELRPVIQPIRNAADAIADILPLHAIFNLRETINEWLEKATSMADSMDQPDDVAENQDLLRDIILPGIKRGIARLRGKVSDASTWVTDAIGGLVTKVTDFFGSLSANALLSPLSGAIQWLSDEAGAIGRWASQTVVGLCGHADEALATLDRWIDPVFAMLQKLVTALGDLMGHLGDLVLGPLLLVPRCIRDPIKDFIVTQILSQIPIFSQLIQLPDIWARIQPAFRAIIVQVFRDGNLFRAAWIFFRTVLDLLNVPPQLVTNLIRNAARAIGDILRDPIGFLGNVLTAIKQGLLQFLDHIGRHLLDGALNWLLSGVQGPGIHIPTPFEINLRNVLDLVFQVLDVTRERIFQRIEARRGPEAARRARQLAAAGEQIFGWLETLVNEGPAGLWRQLQSYLSNLWSTLLNMVIQYLIGRIVQQATLWVTTTLASGGFSAILDAIRAVYNAIQVVAQYLRQLLEVLNSVCEGISDIAHGVLDRAANMVESAAARLIPPVLAFLARMLGIGDLPEVIGQGIQRIRQTVERAIDSLIDRTFAAIDRLRQAGRRAIAAVRDWWRARRNFTANGEQHSVYIDGSRENPRLMVASNPATYAAYIEGLHVDASDEPTRTEAANIARRVDDAIAAAARDRTAPGGTPTDHSAEIDQLLGELSEVTRTLMSRSAAGRSTPTIFGSLVNTFGSSATVARLTPVHDEGEPAGNAPGNTLWETLRLRRTASGGSTYYVRGHLLNERLGGPAQWQNLTPITQATNNRSAESMLHNFENQVKRRVNEQRRTVTFAVTANYGRPSRAADIAAARASLPASRATTVTAIMQAEQSIPLSLDCSAHDLNADGSRGSPVAQYRAENVIETNAASYNVAP